MGQILEHIILHAGSMLAATLYRRVTREKEIVYILYVSLTQARDWLNVNSARLLIQRLVNPISAGERREWRLANHVPI